MEKRFRLYYLTTCFSILFALAGFSYNVWRIEVSEINSTNREASMQMFITLSELESIVFASHYDPGTELDNPRLGWVKIGLISELSLLTNSQNIQNESQKLKATWQSQWGKLEDNSTAANTISQQIDKLRTAIRHKVSRLK